MRPYWSGSPTSTFIKLIRHHLDYAQLRYDYGMDRWFDRLWGTVNETDELWKLGEYQKALKLLDDAIAYWAHEGNTNSIRTLCHFAAQMCDSAGKVGLVKHYYEQSLTYNPENPVALYGLADVALKQGDTDLAKQYAKRPYKAAAQDDDEVARRELFDVIAQKWPDIVPN